MLRLLTLVLLAGLLAPSAASAAPAVPAGALTQLPGASGCLLGPAQMNLLKASACAPARGMGSTQHVTLSPDGRFAYASSNDTWGIVAFRRDPKTGVLTQLKGKAGCTTDVTWPRAGCATARGLVWAFSIVVSPDGRSVYVTGGIGNAIAVFRRDPSTGVLTQPSGPDGCLRNTTGGTKRGGPTPAASGCRLVDGLVYPRGIAVSPDSRFVYTVTSDGRTITGFARDATTSALTGFAGNCVADAKKPGCTLATELAGGTDLTLTRNGRFAYAAAFKGNAVTAFARDPATGVLTQLAGAGGCVAVQPTAGCTGGRALRGVYNLTLSDDERQVYGVSRFSRAIAVLSRDPQTGALSQRPGAAGCVAQGAATGCGKAIGLFGARGVAVSPDGRTVYAGAFSSSAITTYARNPQTGAITQLKGRAGCASYSRTGKGTPQTAGCGAARAIKQAWSIAVSRDGRFVYTGVGGDDNSGIAVFRRATT
ncbi:MAG: beta-propeller fold lactonase family protein [Solirubrobacteraceae bacterium]|nr:beta-propeller fold lactonase family protein [Solirubrobacteraceae bacterium]